VLVDDSSDWAEPNLETSRSSERQLAKPRIICDRWSFVTCTWRRAFGDPCHWWRSLGSACGKAWLSGHRITICRCYNARFPNSLFYLFADPFVPVHDRSRILHPQSLHLPMIAAGRSACLPGGQSELPTLSPWQLFQAKYLGHSCMYLPTSVLHRMLQIATAWLSPRSRFPVAANGIWLSW